MTNWPAKPATLEKVYGVAGISEPKSQRAKHERTETFKHAIDELHPPYVVFYDAKKLKSRSVTENSRRCFSKLEDLKNSEPYQDERSTALVKTSLITWGLKDEYDNKCHWGQLQDIEHLLIHSYCLVLDIAQYWPERLWSCKHKFNHFLLQYVALHP